MKASFTAEIRMPNEEAFRMFSKDIPIPIALPIVCLTTLNAGYRIERVACSSLVGADEDLREFDVIASQRFFLKVVAEITDPAILSSLAKEMYRGRSGAEPEFGSKGEMLFEVMLGNVIDTAAFSALGLELVHYAFD